MYLLDFDKANVASFIPGRSQQIDTNFVHMGVDRGKRTWDPDAKLKENENGWDPVRCQT